VLRSGQPTATSTTSSSATATWAHRPYPQHRLRVRDRAFSRARIIAYQGDAPDTFSIYNRTTGRTTSPNVDGLGIDGTDLAGISAEGRFVLFTGGTLTHGVVVGMADRRCP